MKSMKNMRRFFFFVLGEKSYDICVDSFIFVESTRRNVIGEICNRLDGLRSGSDVGSISKVSYRMSFNDSERDNFFD